MCGSRHTDGFVVRCRRLILIHPGNGDLALMTFPVELPLLRFVADFFEFSISATNNNGTSNNTTRVFRNVRHDQPKPTARNSTTLSDNDKQQRHTNGHHDTRSFHSQQTFVQCWYYSCWWWCPYQATTDGAALGMHRSHQGKAIQEL